MKYLAYALLCLVVIASCKKDKPSPTPAPPKTTCVPTFVHDQRAGSYYFRYDGSARLVDYKYYDISTAKLAEHKVFEYDNLGRLIKTYDSTYDKNYPGGYSLYEYNPDGTISKVTGYYYSKDSGKIVTAGYGIFLYNNNKQIIVNKSYNFQSVLGRKIYYSYDGQGNIIQKKYVDFNLQGDSSSDFSNTYTYDNQRGLLSNVPYIQYMGLFDNQHNINNVLSSDDGKTTRPKYNWEYNGFGYPRVGGSTSPGATFSSIDEITYDCR